MKKKKEKSAKHSTIFLSNSERFKSTPLALHSISDKRISQLKEDRVDEVVDCGGIVDSPQRAFYFLHFRTAQL